MVKRALAIVLTFQLAIAGLMITPKPAEAVVGEADFLAAALLLSKYNLVQGDERGLRVYDEINRAELAKLLVHSLAMEAEVRDFTGRNDFTDTKGHWADGYISLAKRVGLLKGYPGGEFRPNAPISYAEVVTVLARLVGIEGSKEPWPNTYIQPAREVGIIPDGMESVQNLQGAANRGDVFVLLKRTLADVKNFAGQTLLQRYLDKTPPAVTLDPLPTETADTRVTVTGVVKDGAAIRINGAPAAMEYGFFQHNVDLRLGPNTIRVHAFDEAGNMAEKTAQITRLVGAATTVELTGPKTVAAGGVVQFRLKVRDRNGEELPVNQAEAIISPDLGRFDVTTGKFSAGGKTGQATITVLAGNAQATTSIDITTGVLSQLAVSPADVQVGPSQTYVFSATGADALGNQVAVSDVKWSASGGTISETGEFKTPATPGTFTITATAGGRSATATVRPLNYKVASVQVVAPAGILRANAKSETTLTATLRDATGAPVTDYAGTVTVISSAPGTLTPTKSEWPVVNGVATITARTGATAGSATLSVQTNLGKTGTIAITVSPQLIQTVRLTGALFPTANGITKGTVEAAALDQDGNPLLTPLNQTMILRLTIAPAGGLFVTNNSITEDLPMGTLDPTAGDVRGRAEIIYTAGSGTLTISGTVVTANLSYVGVLAGAFIAGPGGPATQVRIEPVPETVAGQLRVITVNLVDKDGFAVANPTGVTVALRDQTGATWAAAACPCVPASQMTFSVTQIKSGTYTYTATLLPGGNTASATTSVVPDIVSAITLTAAPTPFPADNTAKVILKAELLDANNNKVTTGSYPITFNKITSTGATQAFATQVVNSVGGEAHVTVTAGTVVAAETYSAALQAPLPTVTVTVAVTALATPHRLSLAYPDTNGSLGTAGQPVTVRAAVVDANGTLLTYDNGRSIKLTMRNSTTLVETTQTVTTTDGIADFKITRADTGTLAVKAEAGTLIKGLSVGYGGVASDLVIQPGVSTAIRVSSDVPTIKNDSGKSYAVVSVQLLDPNNNVTTNQTGAPISVTVKVAPTTLTTGYFTVDDTVSGFQVNTRTVVIPPGSTTGPVIKLFSKGTTGTNTITATTSDGGLHSTSVTVASLGLVKTLKVDTIGAVALEPYANADGVVSGQTVTVTAVNASGTRVTDFGANAESITLTAEGDARIVAYWDSSIRTWKSIDATLGNGIGDFPSVLSVAADRGQAIFRVRAATAGTKVYRIGYGAVATAVSITGDFTPAAADHLMVQVGRRQVTGGGDQVPIQARVRDQYGNTLTTITGPIQFSVAVGGTAGDLLTTTAELVNGIATVYYQSKLNVAMDTLVTVNGWSTALWPSGNTVTGGSSGLPATDQFSVDGTPSLQGVAATSIGTGTVSVADPGDEIILTFSENIDATTLPTSMAGLSVKFDTATSSIAFVGAPGLGTLYLWPGAISADNTFAVAAVTGTGVTVSVTLGTRLTAGPNTSLNFISVNTATASMNGSVRNVTGSGAFGPFTLVPVTGDF